MDEAGIMSLQSYETLAPEHLKDEAEGPGGRFVSALQRSEQQTSLHCRKEQKRRLQIKAACQRMCDLLPFTEGPLDIATTLELTSHYVSYLTETLPPRLLSKINEAVERKSSLRKNVPRPQKKCYERKTVRLKKNAAERARPASRKSKKALDYVPARSSQKKTGRRVNHLPMIVPKPAAGTHVLPQVEALTAVRAPPILLDKSTVPWGQMLPVRADQFLPDSFQFVDNNWLNPSSPFLSPASCGNTSAMLGHDGSSSGHVSWEASHGSAEVFPPVSFGQAQQSVVDLAVPSEQTEPSEAGPSISSDFSHQLFASRFQSAPSVCGGPTPPDGAHQVSDALCDSRRVLEGDPLADCPRAEAGSFWVDLLLESSSDDFRFPDASLVERILSSEAVYQQ